MPEATGTATLKEVREFFGMSLPDFRKEWTQGGLSPTDKDHIRNGIGDGTLTY